MNAETGLPIDHLFAAIGSRDVGAVDSLLAENAALLDGRSSGGMRPTTAAIYGGDAQVLQTLLRHGARLDLFDAAALGDVDRVRESLAHDPATVSAYSEDGWTALHLAGHFNRSEVATVLLDSGAEIGALSHNRNGNTALHAALAGRAVETARVLVQRGADVNVPDAAGYTPLHLAAHEGNAELVQLLLDAGADRSATRTDGATPADLAAAKGHTEIAASLRA